MILVVKGDIMKKIRGNKGFTLVELIVVIGILAVLASIAIPNLVGMVEKSKQAKDEANAKMLADVTTMWIAESENDAAFDDFIVGHSVGALNDYLLSSFVELPLPQSKKYKGAGRFYIEHDGNGKVTVKSLVGGELKTVYPKP